MILFPYRFNDNFPKSFGLCHKYYKYIVFNQTPKIYDTFQILQRCQISSKLPESKCDRIGPPHPVSNLRPISFKISKYEAPIERRLRLKREEVQNWNQQFWMEHNSRFIEERKEFIAANQLTNSDTPLTADEMSLFYKSFLDKNWTTHVDYNMKWYKNNAQLVALHLRVKLFWLWQHWKLK